MHDGFPSARTMQQMIDTMERMTEDPCTGGNNLPLFPETIRDRYSGYGRENEYRVRFDMPGMTKNGFKVWVEESMLVVKAEKLPRNRAEDEVWPTNSYGSYSSRIALPENIVSRKLRQR
ncbi:hypothetical protein Pint_02893 [Pistacia integerrima]|uniref:Uncharacterized protein n=1 Tax=Pistacia integerrima TaxID=434235 RepID=A0ACC0ZFC4_9ROSI|nr:hypothetical protein Pint_02893 [Pistacia integerrima]